MYVQVSHRGVRAAWFQETIIFSMHETLPRFGSMTNVSRNERGTCLRTESIEYEVGLCCQEAALGGLRDLFLTPAFAR